jgi:hypothetical protein
MECSCRLPYFFEFNDLRLICMEDWGGGVVFYLFILFRNDIFKFIFNEKKKLMFGHPDECKVEDLNWYGFPWSSLQVQRNFTWYSVFEY